MTILHVFGAREPAAAAEFIPLAAALARLGLSQAAAAPADFPAERALMAAGLQMTVQPFGGLFDSRTAPNLATFARAVHARVLVQWCAADQRFLPRGGWGRVGRPDGAEAVKGFSGGDYLVCPDKAAADQAAAAGWGATRVLLIPRYSPFIPSGDEALDKAALAAEEQALNLWRGLFSRFGEV